MSTSCVIVRRGDFFDIYLNDKKCGSGSWGWVDSAVWFYKHEGFDVLIRDGQ